MDDDYIKEFIGDYVGEECASEDEKLSDDLLLDVDGFGYELFYDFIDRMTDINSDSWNPQWYVSMNDIQNKCGCKIGYAYDSNMNLVCVRCGIIIVEFKKMNEQQKETMKFSNEMITCKIVNFYGDESKKVKITLPDDILIHPTHDEWIE